jgi:hypothetical protein
MTNQKMTSQKKTSQKKTSQKRQVKKDKSKHWPVIPSKARNPVALAVRHLRQAFRLRGLKTGITT